MDSRRSAGRAVHQELPLMDKILAWARCQMDTLRAKNGCGCVCFDARSRVGLDKARPTNNRGANKIRRETHTPHTDEREFDNTQLNPVRAYLLRQKSLIQAVRHVSLQWASRPCWMTVSDPKQPNCDPRRTSTPYVSFSLPGTRNFDPLRPIDEYLRTSAIVAIPDGGCHKRS
jgi:hypothetical protein